MAETELTGTLARITFRSETTAWTVGRLVPDGREDEVPVVGDLVGVSPGERLRLLGEWVTNTQYGRQFQFRTYTTLVPATVDGIRKYLSSGLVEGIGEELARRLTDRFGAKTLDVIERMPERLRDVDGIGKKRAASIRVAYEKGRSVRDIMVFLHSHGVSTHFAAKIFERYADDAVRVVRGNPYQLAVDIHGIGFLTADRIARELGIGTDAPARAEAGLLHCLAEAVSEGHVYLPGEELFQAAEALLQVERGPLERALGALAQRRAVVVEAAAPAAPGPAGAADRVWLPWLQAAETSAAAALRRLLVGAERAPTDADRALVDRVGAAIGVTLAPAQRQALQRALVARVLVVTGGPGTGKTTIVRGIVRLLRELGKSVALAAPTGRASRRLQEAAELPAKTIHRLLEFSPKEGGFQRTGESPLPHAAVVVDEASMLDISLFNALLLALLPDARLVLVGDVDQLPSVGPGAVLADLIGCGRVPVVRLTEVFRQSQQSAIVRNAHRILHGADLEDGAPDPAGALSDFYVVVKEEPEEVLAVVERLLKERIPQRFGLDPRRDVQVLSPMYRGILGTDHLNERLQELLNPHGEKVAAGGGRFRVGDKVMQVRNDYDKEVFNGDVGVVSAWDAGEKALLVAFDGRAVVYPSTDLHELVLAYAVSVHKSQGSEYPAVVIPLHTQHFVMLQRNLFYTGVTRGRRLVVVVGNRRGIGRAIRNDEQRHRWTRLRERLID